MKHEFSRSVDVRRNGDKAGASMLTNQAWKEVARSLKLSGREMQIVAGMFDDGTELAIACDLGISPHTVHTHIERLYRKLSVTNRVQLILRVFKEFVELTSTHGTDLPPICPNYTAGKCRVRVR